MQKTLHQSIQNFGKMAIWTIMDAAESHIRHKADFTANGQLTTYMQELVRWRIEQCSILSGWREANGKKLTNLQYDSEIDILAIDDAPSA